MRTSRWEARRSTGAGLVSIGSVLIVIAALLVVVEAPQGHAQTSTHTALCHGAGGSGNYVYIAPDDSSHDGEGHLNHRFDIIPGHTLPGSSPPREATIDDVMRTCGPDPVVSLVKAFSTENPSGLDAEALDFAPTLDGDQTTWGDHELEAGTTYTVGEIDLGSHTDPGSYEASIACVGGSASGNSTGVLSRNETVTCTITNIYRPLAPTVTFVKVFDASNPGGLDAVAGDFAPTYGTTQTTWGTHTFAVGDGPFDVGENDLDTHADPGTYTASVVCEGGAASGMSTGVLGDGDEVTCTITNTYVPKPPTVTFRKAFDAQNPGGLEADAGDFAPTYGTTPTTWGTRTFAVGDGPFTIGENDLGQPDPGSYSASVVCEGGSASGSSTGVLGDGDAVTCAITNTYVEPGRASVTVTKIVDTVGGLGTATVGDFDLFVGTTGVTSGVALILDAAGSYTVSESGGPSGYTAVIGGDCAADGSITVALGESYACTITNTFDPPTLTVTKTVVGGTASVGDFTLTVTPVGAAGVQVASGVATQFGLGSHIVSETNLPGYEAGAWGGDCDVEGVVDLATPGEDYECTITNTDPRAQLTVTKIVIGDGDPADFPLTVTAATGAIYAVQSGVAAVFAAGTYTVAEQNLEGYAAGQWSGACDPSTGVIVMQPGGTYTCTITNISTTTTTPVATTVTVLNTTVTRGTSPGTTAPTGGHGDDLPRTGSGLFMAMLLGGLGLALLGAGLVLLSPRRQRSMAV